MVSIDFFRVAITIYKANLLECPRVRAAFYFEAFIVGFFRRFPGEFGLVGFGSAVEGD
ncbi:hypothetical protein D3C87_2198050 [compost metagenome]